MRAELAGDGSPESPRGGCCAGDSVGGPQIFLGSLRAIVPLLRGTPTSLLRCVLVENQQHFVLGCGQGQAPR